MTNQTLAQAYLKKSMDRLDILDLLHGKGAYSDVVREAQEIVELALKGMLRSVGVEPPKYHDVGRLLLSHKDRFDKSIAEKLKKAADISKWLRKERELSFYGDIDFIPTEEYSIEDSRRAREDAKWVVALAGAAIAQGDSGL
ncbi:MAG: HEPN domain-containing protein [Deltaproteobacteria bacterium]|nr:HEPN domain-containing protein [Deltaproteobacteria bacterium]MBW1996147.1 HEPN domain-containing protein [Deltaproteobacteria bacterium]MBW2153555.1 HEPN domain-containing protein [Deltaproteobacteria bacterium]